MCKYLSVNKHICLDVDGQVNVYVKRVNIYIQVLHAYILVYLTRCHWT